MEIKEIRTLTGLSQVAFASKFDIPRRTLENWESGTNTPPAYVLDMLEKVVKNGLGRYEIWQMEVPVSDMEEKKIEPGCTYGCEFRYDPVAHVERFSRLDMAIQYMRLHPFSVDKGMITEYHLYEVDDDEIVGDAIAWSTADGIELN